MGIGYWTFAFRLLPFAFFDFGLGWFDKVFIRALVQEEDALFRAAGRGVVGEFDRFAFSLYSQCLHGQQRRWILE